MNWSDKDDDRIWRTGNLVFGALSLCWAVFFIIIGAMKLWGPRNDRLTNVSFGVGGLLCYLGVGV